MVSTSCSGPGAGAEPRQLDLSAEVTRSFRLVERLVPESVTLDLTLATDPLPVTIDPSQVQQVLMNLVINAGDAARDGGTVGVETGLRAGTPGSGSRRAVLTASDDGEGMREAQLSRIFDPFFTTKGEGTGLGLSTVRRIAEDELGRTIRVSSEPDRGSRFEILLPLAAGAEPATPPPRAATVQDGKTRATARDSGLRTSTHLRRGTLGS